MPSVLVTGASQGIGRAIALRQAAAGWHVYAGVREQESALLLAAADPRITPVELDITDDTHLKALPGCLPERLDAVVNNAGIAVLGPVEGLTTDDLRRQFEVNLFGQVAVTRAVLPLVRAAGGRIVFISSVNGRMSVAMEGAYCASKFALEGLADALRVELRPWRVAVSLIEPGPVDTGPWRRIDEELSRMETGLDPEHRELYAAHLAGLRRTTAMLASRTMPPERTARAVEKALSAGRPRARYLVGMSARAMVVSKALVPTPAGDALGARIGGWK